MVAEIDNRCRKFQFSFVIRKNRVSKRKEIFEWDFFFSIGVDLKGRQSRQRGDQIKPIKTAQCAADQNGGCNQPHRSLSFLCWAPAEHKLLK